MWAFPPETGHRLALWSLAHGLGPRGRASTHPSLAINLWGREVPNPVGISGGFDKNATAIAGVMAMGVGFAEVGGITPRPQPGNPRPRLFRLSEDGAAINRFGFNSDGAETVAARIAAWRAAHPGEKRMLGANLAANGDSAEPAADFENLVAAFAPLCDFLTIDISCPNSANGKVFLSPDPLADLFARLNKVRAETPSDRQPLMLAKLAPDVDDGLLGELLTVLRNAQVDGLIVCNTTTERPASLRSPHAGEIGGLSGRPLFEMSTEMLRRVYRMTDGAVPLIGVGGVFSGEDAYKKVRAGASLIQLYTGLVFEGPGLIARIKDELAERLAADGFSSLQDAVGADMQ